MVDVCDLSHVCWLEPHLSLSARIPTNGCSMWPRLPQSMATSVSLDFSHGSSGLQRWMSQLTMQKPLPLLWPRHRKHSVSLPSLHICDKQITSPPTFKKRGFNSTWWQDVGGKVAEEHTGQEILLQLSLKNTVCPVTPLHPHPHDTPSLWMYHSAIHMLCSLCFCTYHSLWLEHLFLPANPYYHLFIFVKWV